MRNSPLDCMVLGLLYIVVLYRFIYMYINTSFKCRTQVPEVPIGWTQPFPQVQVATSRRGSPWAQVPIAISAEMLLLEAIPGVPVSMVTGDRELSLTRTVAHRARGRREILRAFCYIDCH